MNAPLLLRAVLCTVRRVAIPVVGAALLATPARAFQFSHGQLEGSFDTTLSFGGLYRLENPDAAFYGTSKTFNGVPGQQNSVNTDDGNVNYDKGWASELLKGSHDLELRYGDFGMLVRGYWFKDFRADDTLRTPLSDQAKDRVVEGAELLDLYVRGKFTLGSMPLDVRVGRQVLSLGESTFIPNGINVVNSADLAKLRVPGSELKEALLPVNMVKASLGVSDNLTIEPFWLLEFRRNELEPAGSYFSTNDFASRGGSNVWLGFGTIPEGSPFGGIPRENDREGSNFNQYGVSARYLAEKINNTEFGLHYLRYNSRSPVISARTPAGPVDTNLTTPLTLALIRAGIPAAQAGPQAVAIFDLVVRSQTAPGTLTPTDIATLQSAQVQAAIAGARQIALLTAATTGRYFIEYPEGLDMYGASFNTSLGNSGISWQGEASLKTGVPLQVDDVEVLFAALSALAPNFAPPNNQIGNFIGQYGREVTGYRRHKVWTAQSTLTKVFGPMLGSDQFTLVGEVGAVWADLPSKSTLRYEGAATFTSASAAAMASAGSAAPATPSGAFADDFSWGYQVLGRLEYTNVLPNVTIAPTFVFTHDVDGNTPIPLGNYLKHRKSVNVAVEFTYRNAWSLELRYVNFFGGGRYNLFADRDYAATTVKYSF